MNRVLLALLIACGQPAKPVESEAKPMDVAVTDSAGLAAAKDQRAKVTGTAGNAKLGAVVTLPDRTPVYCVPLDAWPDEVTGKSVTAYGTLEQSTQFMARGDAAGTGGPIWVLRDCTYDPP